MKDCEPVEASEMSSVGFNQLGLDPLIIKLLSEIGYEAPSPIQARSIPPLLAGNDLLGLAQTGTGKTAAFALPIISKLDLTLAKPQALILVPTRELAIQVSEAFQKYATYIDNFHVLPIYGGQDMRGQLKQLKRGVHVVVGTPGRVMDHIRRRSLVLDGLTTMVLDEADEMLRMGFIDDVEWILEYTPEEKQVALFSATMPRAIKNISARYLNNATEVKIAAKTATVERITQLQLVVNAHQKVEALTRVLEVEDFDGIIIFVRTKLATLELAQKLEARGYTSSGLNGDMDQKQREATIDRLRKGKIDIVVATDVAARGIDVTRVSHVINYDLPYDPESYVHRIGRTGRAGRSGRAILFVTPRERHLLRMIERTTKQPIEPLKIPTHQQISEHRISTFKDSVMAVLNQDEEGRQINIADYREIVDQLVLQSEASIEELATGLLYMAQKERPLFVPKNHDLDNPKSRNDRKTLSRGKDTREGRHRDRGAPGRGRDRHDRYGDRNDRGQRSDGRGRGGQSMDLYRLAVGRSDDVSPREIVGAIANEADMSSQNIGKISIFDNYSTVELPKGLSKDVLRTLKGTWVKQRRMQIERVEGGAAQSPRSQSPRHGAKGSDAGDRPRFSDKKRERSSNSGAPRGKRPEQRFEGGEGRSDKSNKGGGRRSNANSPKAYS